jgi:hypothetical protein
VGRGDLVINVKDYGAKGDGVTDDIASINSAIAAIPAGGATLYFPRGNYLISGTVTIDIDNVTIAGEGPASVITLKPGATGVRNVIRCNSSSSSTPPRRKNFAIKNLAVNANGGDQTWAAGGIPGAIQSYATDGVNYDHLLVINGRDYCVATHSCTMVRFSFITADTCYWQGASNPLNAQAGASLDTEDVIFDHCFIKHTTTVAISSATASGGVATFTTSTAHKMSVGQPIKVTGVSVPAYNGYRSVASVPSPTTFTATIGSTPSAATGGTLTVQADKNIYVGSLNAFRLIAAHNLSQGCFGAISAEVGSPGAFDLQITNNVVSDFSDHGVAAENSSGSGVIYAHRYLLADNIIRGKDGTSEFGVASSGSLRGIVAHGEMVRVSNNVISNCRIGIEAGNNLDVEETDFAINDNTVVMAADGNGSGIYIPKGVGTNYLRRLQIRSNQVDGQLTTTSSYGIRASGRIIDFDITDNTVRGFGRSGIYLEASGGIAPTVGRIRGNDCIDNNTANGGSIQNQVGIALDPGCNDIALAHNKCYDTRGPKLQTYGLRVDATATSVRSVNDDFAGNLTGEVSDGTNGAQFYRLDYRDPLGLGAPIAVDPRTTTAMSSLGAANRILYVRVTSGGGLCSKIGVYIGTIDSTTPGTTDQIAVAVYSGTGSGRSAVPGTQKAVSVSTTANANNFNQVALNAAVRINTGDWIAVGVASNTTQIQGTTPSNGLPAAGFSGFQDTASPVPPTTPAMNSGTSARTPTVVGIP